MMERHYAVIGGGIIGVAVARELLGSGVARTVTVLEREAGLARHQTGRNSGVVHAGLYYAPGSLKARLCRRGGSMLKEFCSEHDVGYEEIGKVVVALDSMEARRLDEIEARSRANGVPGIRRLCGRELGEIEPRVVGVDGLYSPTSAIADFPGVTEKMAELVRQRGGAVRLGADVVDLSEKPGGVRVTVRTNGWRQQETYDRVVICGGLQADRLARKVGGVADPRIIPFRGEYYALRPERRGLVNGLVYPVPDPRYPFLGVHLTPRVSGEVLIGPNAVLALAREGYTWTTVSGRDLAQTLGYHGFVRFARRNWRAGVQEMTGSLSRKRFIAAARRYVPELSVDDVVRGPRGVRAQAMDRDGALVDDFRIDHGERVTALRNAPSPAATASLAIAEYLVSTIAGGRKVQVE